MEVVWKCSMLCAGFSCFGHEAEIALVLDYFASLLIAYCIFIIRHFNRKQAKKLGNGNFNFSFQLALPPNSPKKLEMLGKC